MSIRPLELLAQVWLTLGALKALPAWQATLETVASLVGVVVKQGQGLHGVLPGDSESLASES